MPCLSSGHYCVTTEMIPNPDLKAGDKVIVATRKWSSCKHLVHETGWRVVGVATDCVLVKKQALSKTRCGEDSVWKGDPVYSEIMLEEWHDNN